MIAMQIRKHDLVRGWLILLMLYKVGILSAFITLPNIVLIFFDVSPILLFILCLDYHINDCIYRYLNYVNKFIFAYIVIWIAQLVWTYFNYSTRFDISFILLIRRNIYWLEILLVYPIIYVIAEDGGIEKFVKELIKIIVLGTVLRFISWFFYSTNGTIVFESFIRDGLSDLRSGSIFRLSAGSFAGLAFAFLLCFMKPLDEKLRKGYLVVALLSFAYQVFIGQSRAMIVCYIVTFIVWMYYFGTNSTSIGNSGYRSALMVLIFIAAAVLLFSGVASESLSIFSTTSSNSSYATSTSQRLYAINYYWELLKEHPFMGIGLLYDDSDELGYMASILRGNATLYETAYLEDLGILGTIFQRGIIGSIPLLMLIYRWYSSVKHLRFAGGEKAFYYGFMRVVFVMALFMSLTTYCVYHKNLMYITPIIFALCEYIRVKTIEEGEEEYAIYDCDDGL